MKNENTLTIIMYHYVRPIANSKFPGIKGLEISGFKRQLDYLETNFNIISSEDVIQAVTKNRSLPPKACWLTFDDGYKDHFRYVLPELLDRNISGAFFPPSTVIQNAKMLNVNSIHHILASTTDTETLVKRLNSLCLEVGLNAEQIKSFYDTFAIENRFDNATTIYFKRMLQHALPEEIRDQLVTTLFEEYIGVNERTFSGELYMNLQEVKQLVQMGMYVGSHGAMHPWLNQLPKSKQQTDILLSLEFLEEVGTSTTNWIMCYPYGAYNNTTISLLKEFKASLAVTTEVRTAHIGHDHALKLPRFDTNDFPQ